ncbi:DUF3152 domain-containing protein [Streptomyces sp. NBC_01508]|uniref:DUF3152 domain-containing protein n=1 Tax=Streptomyces sp. NBC_01508 TaxID=2903888 RepID=UPI003868F368
MGRHSRKGPAPQGSDSKKRAPSGGTPPAGERAAPPAPPPGERDHAAPAYGTPAHGVPQVRGGHPEHPEPGGGWGGQQRYGDWQGGGGGPQGSQHPQHPQGPQQQQPGPGRGTGSAPTGGRRRVPGPRREFIDAFDAPPSAHTPATDRDDESGRPGVDSADGSVVTAAEGDAERPAKSGLGRTFTGIAAAAVTTVLAVVVAGQVTDGGGSRADARPSGEVTRDGEDAASRSDGRPTPKEPAVEAPALPLTYSQLMTKQFPLAADLQGSGEFEAVPGLAEAPGEGLKVRYRIDVEKGLGLDEKLFADAVHRTLNDDRSWAHNGAMTFERIAKGTPRFVITLASPGTTAEWCAKSGLDTSVDNVSCDSAATDRVMINAFRWARGAETYGPKAMHTYRQMLINHEIGHRLGHDHVSCRTPGSLAPVMQQQTKTLDLDGVKCKPNPWAFPGS